MNERFGGEAGMEMVVLGNPNGANDPVATSGPMNCCFATSRDLFRSPQFPDLIAETNWPAIFAVLNETLVSQLPLARSDAGGAA